MKFFSPSLLKMRSSHAKHITLTSLALLVLGSSNAFAQTATTAAQQQAEQIARDQAAQQRERRLQALREQSRLRKPDDEAEQQASDASLDQGPCFDIQTITVTGSNVIAQSAIQSAIKDLTPNCLNLNDLNLILKRITGLYLDKGYIASRAYLPEQDLKDGSLEVTIVEGALEDYIWNNDPLKNKDQLQMAFPHRKGKIVNLRDIEQGLDQINRLQSNNSQMQLTAGSKLGQSILSIQNQSSKPWYARVNFDNLGSQSTGKFKSALTFGYDDLLNLNDSLSLTYTRSMEDSNLNWNADLPLSDTLNVNYSVPYGYWTFSIAGTHSHYESSIQGLFGDINTSGRSNSWSFTADKVIHRDQTSKTSVSSTFLRKDNKSFLLNSLIETSSRALVTANLSLTHSRQLFGGQALGSVTYERGLDLFDAFSDVDAPLGSPKGQFDKLSWSLGYTKQQKIGGFVLGFDTQFSGQWSDDLLFGSEQMSLGGISSVRGVMESQLSGNNAILSRNEMSLRLPATGEPFMDKVFGVLEGYAAYDVGHVFEQREHDIDGDSLSGGALGLRTVGGKFSVDVSISDILSAPTRLDAIKRQPAVVYAKSSFSF